MATKPIDYQALNDELEAIITKLQSGDVTIDEAMPAYERGVIIVGQLEKYLTSAKNSVTALQAKLQD